MTDSTFTLDFVDSISASPTYRLRLNSGALSVLAERSSFGLPQLRQARSSTILADGDHIAASSWTNRIVDLEIGLPTDRDQAATWFQAIMREVNREENILRYRLGTTEPAYFNTFRSAIADVRWDAVANRCLLRVEAKPFGFGEPVSLGAVVVNADPAAVSNPTYFDVSDVKGDVPAATLIVETNGDWFNTGVLVASRRRGDPANVPYLAQAESMTLGTDMTLPGNDATMSGTGSNYARCSFATIAMVTRLTASWPSGTNPHHSDTRGTYRVLVRARHSVAGDAIDVRLAVGTTGFGSPQFYNKTVRLTTTGTGANLYDLGLIQLPVGQAPVSIGPSGTAAGTAHVNVYLQAQRVSGSGNADFDYLVFVPADEQLMLLDVGNDWTDDHLLDSYHDQVYGGNITGYVGNEVDSIGLGGMPELVPGNTNRIYVMRGIGADSSSNSISATNQLNITYWPRYMLARPVGT